MAIEQPTETQTAANGTGEPLYVVRCWLRASKPQADAIATELRALGYTVEYAACPGDEYNFEIGERPLDELKRLIPHRRMPRNKATIVALCVRHGAYYLEGYARAVND